MLFLHFFFKVVSEQCAFTLVLRACPRTTGTGMKTPEDSKWTHKGFTKGLTNRPTKGLTKGFTKDSQRTHKRIHKRTHKGLTKEFTKGFKKGLTRGLTRRIHKRAHERIRKRIRNKNSQKDSQKDWNHESTPWKPSNEHPPCYGSLLGYFLFLKPVHRVNHPRFLIVFLSLLESPSNSYYSYSFPILPFWAPFQRHAILVLPRSLWSHRSSSPRY